MIRSINVPLDEAAFRALGQLAERELRPLRMQAAAAIVATLRREGLVDEHAHPRRSKTIADVSHEPEPAR